MEKPKKKLRNLLYGKMLQAAGVSLFVMGAVLLPPKVKAAGCDDTQACTGAVFCSGFEEGNKNIWDDYDGNPDSTNLLLADNGPCSTAGNTVMRLRVPAGTGGADLVKILPSSHDKLYARWYQKWEEGYDFSARNHGSGLFGGDRNYLGQSGIRPTGSDWFGSFLEPIAGSTAGNNGRMQLYSYYRGMYQDCADPFGSCWGDIFPCTADDGSSYCTKPEHRETILPPQMETGRWYCMETMIDAGSAVGSDFLANGQQDFWIDGVEYGPWQGLWHRTTTGLKVSGLWLNLYHHESHSVQGIMLDNVVVSTERIGCLGQSNSSSFGFLDFLQLLTDWLTSNTASDKNSDGLVNARDLGIIMSGWE